MAIFLKLIQVVLGVDVGVVLFCWLEERWDWLLNTQLALFSTLLIVIGSFTGYRKLIQRRVAEVKQWEGEEEQRTPGIGERLLLGAGGMLNPLRLLGYGGLVGSFFYLYHNYLFRPIPFLFGVTLVPVLGLVVAWLYRGEGD